MAFLDYLATEGAITEAQIVSLRRAAEEKHHGRLDLALAAIGITDDVLLPMKSTYFNIPIRSVDPKSFPFDVLKYVSADAASLYQFVPLSLSEGILEVGIVDPENTKTFDAIQFTASKLNVPFKVFLIARPTFEAILGNYAGVSGEVAKATEAIEISAAKEISLPAKGEEKIVEEAPIIKIVDVIINNAVEGGASDIHIENIGDKVKVRYRVDGVLHTTLTLPLNVFASIVARVKILAKLRLDEKRKPQDGSFSARVAGRKVDFRVSSFPSVYGEKVVLRILDVERGIRSLTDLGMTEKNLTLIKEAIDKPYGLILLTGPTGSGKTTTLYAMLKELDRETNNVVSLEDPVEYSIPGVNQSQVMPEIGYTFAAGLRSILRQDPDIIMVGEIRDKETATLAIQAALTGHLVFSTLHTNTSLGVVPRLVDMGIDPYLIAPTLILTVAQRLVQATCPESKKAIPTPKSLVETFESQFADLPPAVRKEIKLPETVYETVSSAGCPEGTKGRSAIYEMFKVDKTMADVILKNPVESEIYKAARAQGMLTLKEDALLKAVNGQIPMAEVYGLEVF